MIKQKKLCVLASFDSFIKASVPIVDIFRKNGHEISIFVVKFDHHERYIKLYNQDVSVIDSYIDPGFVKEALNSNYLMISLAGGSIRQLVSHLSDKLTLPKRPLIFAGYCGLVYEKQLIGATSRINLDVYYVNSKNDYNLFNKYFEDLDVDSNVYLTGLPLFDKYASTPRRDPGAKGIVFAAQPTVPWHRKHREYTLKNFIELAKAYPQYHFYFKPRGNPKEKTFHTEEYYYQDLLNDYKEELPANFEMTETKIQELFKKSFLCISVSSTALIEAHLMGLKTAVLIDYGIEQQLGNHYFNGSGSYTNFKKLKENIHHLNNDESWFKNNLEISGNNTQRLYEIVTELEPEVSMAPIRNYQPFYDFDLRPFKRKVTDKLKRILKRKSVH